MNKRTYLLLGAATVIGVVGWTVWLPLILIALIALGFAVYSAYQSGNRGRHVLAGATAATVLMAVVLLFTRVLNIRPQGSSLEGFMTFTMLLALASIIASIVGYILAYRSAATQQA